MDNKTKAMAWVGVYWVLGYTLGLCVYFGFLGAMDSWGLIVKEDWNEWVILASFMIFPQITAYLCTKCNFKLVLKKYDLEVNDGKKGEE